MAFQTKKDEPAFHLPGRNLTFELASSSLTFLRRGRRLETLPVRDNYKSIIFQLSMHYRYADVHYLTAEYLLLTGTGC